MAKHLVIGAYGMIGSAIVNELKSRNQEVVSFSTCYRIENDVQVLATVEFIQPDYIWLCAAYTNVTLAETDPLSEVVNIDGVRNVCQAAQHVGAKLVFFSSSYVFDGMLRKPYSEWDTPHPLSVYGMQKMVGESMVRLVDSYCIIRTCAVYGIDTNRRAFPYKVLEILKSQNALWVAADEIVCPINSKHLASLSVDVAHRHRGIYHINGNMPLTKFEWAKDIAQLFELSTKNILPVRGDKIRPKNGTLKNSVLVPSYVRGMREFIDDYEAANN